MPGLHPTVAKPTEKVDPTKLWEEKANPDLADTKKMLQTINFKLGSFDDENRTFQAIGSTPQVDRQGDVIEQEGWVLSNFIKNPVIPWAHCYSELPVARALEIGVVGNNLVFTYQAPPEGLYPFADTVWNMYRHQFMFAFSVGFQPLEYDGNWEDGYEFTKCELLEISAVPVPANAGALVLAQKMGVMDSKEARSMADKIEAALKNFKEFNNLDAPKPVKELPKKEVKEVVEETTEVTEELGDHKVTTKKTVKKTDKDEDVKVTIVDQDNLKTMITDILKELGDITNSQADEETDEDTKDKESVEGTSVKSEKEDKDLTNNDNMVQNDNMTEQKSGATISAATKAKIKTVMDGLMTCASDLQAHCDSLSSLAGSEDDDSEKGKSLEKDSKVVKSDTEAEANVADEKSETGAEQTGEEDKTSDTDGSKDDNTDDKSDDKTDESAEGDKTEESEKTEDNETEESSKDESASTEESEKTEESDKTDESKGTDESKETEEKTDETDKSDESKEDSETETEKSAKSDDKEYLIDPDNMSDEDVIKLTAAVQAELDKEKQD